MKLFLLIHLFLSLSLVNANEYSYLQVFNNLEQSLESDFIAPQGSCSVTPKKKKWKKLYKSKETILKDYESKEIKVSLVSLKTMNEIFKEMQAQEDIPFDYPQDGCYARAHKMARLLEAKNIKTAKIFVEGDLKVKTKNTDSGEVEWWFHVAPVLKVKDEKKEVVYVIDPSIFDRPVTLEEWKSIQSQHSKKAIKKTYFTKKFYYTPNDKKKDLLSYEKEDLEDMIEILPRYLKVQQERKAKIE